MVRVARGMSIRLAALQTAPQPGWFDAGLRSAKYSNTKPSITAAHKVALARRSLLGGSTDSMVANQLELVVSR